MQRENEKVDDTVQGTMAPYESQQLLYIKKYSCPRDPTEITIQVCMRYVKTRCSIQRLWSIYANVYQIPCPRSVLNFTAKHSKLLGKCITSTIFHRRLLVRIFSYLNYFYILGLLHIFINEFCLFSLQCWKIAFNVIMKFILFTLLSESI